MPTIRFYIPTSKSSIEFDIKMLKINFLKNDRIALEAAEPSTGLKLLKMIEKDEVELLREYSFITEEEYKRAIKSIDNEE